MATEVPVNETIEIPEGKHTGKIKKLVVRTEPFDYIDAYIEMADVQDSKGNPITLKEGFPLGISLKSKLGTTLIRFGCPESDIESKAKEGGKIDIEPYLLDKEVEFMTKNETTKKGTFARVIDGTLKPAEA